MGAVEASWDDQNARADLPFIRITGRAIIPESQADLGEEEQRPTREDHTLLRRALRPYRMQPGEEFGIDEVGFELRVQGRVAQAIVQEARIHVAHDRQQLLRSERKELGCQEAREIRDATRDLPDRVIHDRRRTITLTLPSVTRMLHG